LAGAAFGVLYGLVLSAIGFVVAVISPGSFFALGLGSAPVCGLGIVAAMAAPPVWWAAVAWLASMPLGSRGRFLARVLLIAHYLSLPLVVLSRRYGLVAAGNATWSEQPLTLSLAVLVYALGQLWLWRSLLRR
jgi:hypothetical protein